MLPYATPRRGGKAVAIGGIAGNTISGKAPAGSKVEISTDDFATVLASVTADSAGVWSYTFASPQPGITVSSRALVRSDFKVPGELARALAFRGMNFSGMDYGSPAVNDPDVTNGWNRPTDASFDYYASRGFNLARIPYLMERCQPGGPNTALGSDTKSAAYLATLVALGNKARAAGMVVLWGHPWTIDFAASP